VTAKELLETNLRQLGAEAYRQRVRYEDAIAEVREGMKAEHERQKRLRSESDEPA
jgi:hypothetical protein